MQRRAAPPGVPPFAAFPFCAVPSLAYPLCVELSEIGNARVGTARLQAGVGTGALARPSRAKLGRPLARSGRSPA
jgi:hypothetical protein